MWQALPCLPSWGFYLDKPWGHLPPCWLRCLCLALQMWFLGLNSLYSVPSTANVPTSPPKSRVLTDVQMCYLPPFSNTILYAVYIPSVKKCLSSLPEHNGHHGGKKSSSPHPSSLCHFITSGLNLPAMRVPCKHRPRRSAEMPLACTTFV